VVVKIVALIVFVAVALPYFDSAASSRSCPTGFPGVVSRPARRSA
jgi:hypothetical protein